MRPVLLVPDGDYFAIEEVARPSPCYETHGHSPAPQPESAEAALPGDNLTCTFPSANGLASAVMHASARMASAVAGCRPR